MRASTECLAHPAQEHACPLVVVARFALEKRCHIALDEGVEHLDLRGERSTQLTARGWEELRCLREEPELLVKAPQDEERLVADVGRLARESARRTDSGACLRASSRGGHPVTKESGGQGKRGSGESNSLRERRAGALWREEVRERLRREAREKQKGPAG